jgi:hypothetical protein
MPDLSISIIVISSFNLLLRDVALKFKISLPTLPMLLSCGLNDFFVGYTLLAFCMAASTDAFAAAAATSIPVAPLLSCD